jgi:hypothetical protein
MKMYWRWTRECKDAYISPHLKDLDHSILIKIKFNKIINTTCNNITMYIFSKRIINPTYKNESVVKIKYIYK